MPKKDGTETAKERRQREKREAEQAAAATAAAAGEGDDTAEPGTDIDPDATSDSTASDHNADGKADEDGDPTAKSNTRYLLSFSKDVFFAGGLHLANSVVYVDDYKTASMGAGVNSCQYLIQETKVGKKRERKVLHRVAGAEIPE